MSSIASIILLYSITTLIAIVARRVRVPYTAALLVAGVALGALHIADVPHLTKELLFAVFLPGLVFEASYRLRAHELRESAWTIGSLAIPGVAVAMLITGGILAMGSSIFAPTHGVDWKSALLFGAVIAATDPVAVTSLLREVRAPRRLHVLLESESLLNDGTSIVSLDLVLSYVAGDAAGPLSLFATMARVAGGGALIGIVAGWGISHVVRRVDDPAIEITLTTIAAYGSFVLAERLHCSGVIATVAAGVMCGHEARQQAMSPATLKAVDSFWKWLAFALTSAVFILLGAEIAPADLIRNWPLIILGAFAAFAGRVCIVLGVASLAGRREDIPNSWLAVLSWGGLRGALSLVLALSLPDTIAARPLIISITGGTVFLSLVGQATTMGMVLRRLKIGSSEPKVDPVL